MSGSVIMHAFAALMLVVGIGMLFGKGRIPVAPGVASRGGPRPAAAVLNAVLTAAAVAGALVGERIARHVSAIKLRRGFGLVVVVVGVTVVLAGGFGGHEA